MPAGMNLTREYVMTKQERRAAKTCVGETPAKTAPNQKITRAATTLPKLAKAQNNEKGPTVSKKRQITPANDVSWRCVIVAYRNAASST
jgi:hypothetical protein